MLSFLDHVADACNDESDDDASSQEYEVDEDGNHGGGSADYWQLGEWEGTETVTGG